MTEDYISCDKCGITRNKTVAEDCIVCKDGKVVNVEKIGIKLKKTYYKYKPTILVKDETEDKIKENLKLYLKKIQPRINDRSRGREVIQDRVQAVCTLRNVYKLSYSEIGRILGHCDHTTARYLHIKYCNND